MGTGFDMAIHPDELGMIPRAVGQIFSGIDECKRSALEKGEPLPHFEVKTQFLEVGCPLYLLIVHVVVVLCHV